MILVQCKKPQRHVLLYASIAWSYLGKITEKLVDAKNRKCPHRNLQKYFQNQEITGKDPMCSKQLADKYLVTQNFISLFLAVSPAIVTQTR